MKLAAGSAMVALVVGAYGAQASVSCGSPDATNTSVCMVDPVIDPSALCNDGTQPAFSLRPGSGAGLGRWLIWLEGGGQCTDTTSCVERAKLAKSLLTSTGFSPKPGDGILSSSAPTNPLLYNANVVLIHYCSSDDWAGDRQSSVAFDPDHPTTWHFQGRRIALAALASVAEKVPTFAAATQIAIGGSSAGGVGITVIANDMLPVLPAAADKRVVNDAGFVQDIGQYDPTAPAPYVFAGRRNAFYALFKSGMALWHGRGDALCNALATSEQERVDCFSAKVFQAGYIGVPTFVAESQLDTAQLSDEICPADYGRCQVSHDPASTEGVYSTAFAHKMAAALVGSGTLATYAVYSPDTYIHTMLTDAKQFSAKNAFPGARLSAQAVFSQWLRGTVGSRIVKIGNGPGVTQARATSR